MTASRTVPQLVEAVQKVAKTATFEVSPVEAQRLIIACFPPTATAKQMDEALQSVQAGTAQLYGRPLKMVL